MKTCGRMAALGSLLAVLSVAVVGLTAADPEPPPAPEGAAVPEHPEEASRAHHMRFRVIEVTPVEQVAKTRILRLEVERFYGKIESDSLDRAEEHETQQLTILFPAAIDADIRPGDLINYRLVDYVAVGRE